MTNVETFENAECLPEARRAAKEKKKQTRKEQKKVAREGRQGKWLSNASMKDASKIKRTFPHIIEGVPRATEKFTVEELQGEGIVGLYLEKK